ncbi:hypothetical protein Halxa_2535 [Halopiger xanaduensis SH-6]|uniref:Uncharacterized protein n=1 Tax=Halopiger xanaduensis (strain DSM 18323 / JCM 14033 / SH-6) TaxID=797210 RepID=F8DC40_HALXS|nr:hypothetical protein Halxa_2535 [Halopiger xanaduensis SH-6]
MPVLNGNYTCVLFGVLQDMTLRLLRHQNRLWSEEMSLLYDRLE